MIAQEAVGSYLERLSAREPTPGGGAAGALHLAQGAALLAMVARFTSGEKFREVQPVVARVARRADELVTAAVDVADRDEQLFGAVIAAYRLPRGDASAAARRTAAIEQATARAAEPQVQSVAIALELIDLADELVPVGNRNVLSDVAAAAEAVRAALGTSVVTLEINARSLPSEQQRRKLSAAVAQAERGMERADQVTQRVRRELAT